MKKRVEQLVGWALVLGAATFLVLLSGFGSGALTDDPPAVNPYATGGDSSDVFETDAYETDGEGSGPSSAADITIAGFSFGDPITVAAGSQVIVTNKDSSSHTWTANDGTFDSGVLGEGDSFSFTFEGAGEFGFFCSIHPSMTGSITIEE